MAKEIPNIYEGRNSGKEIQLNLDYLLFFDNPDLPLMVPFFLEYYLVTLEICNHIFPIKQSSCTQLLLYSLN